MSLRHCSPTLLAVYVPDDNHEIDGALCYAPAGQRLVDIRHLFAFVDDVRLPPGRAVSSSFESRPARVLIGALR
jgi:hypothetical protein